MYQCWALPLIGPQIRKLRTQGFGLRISGKKIEICRKSAKQQHRWDRFFTISKTNTLL